MFKKSKRLFLGCNAILTTIPKKIKTLILGINSCSNHRMDSALLGFFIINFDIIKCKFFLAL